MKKPIIIALGVILFTALGVQTYMFYRLHQQVSELRSGNPFALHFKDNSLPKILPGADVSSFDVKLAGQGLFISVKTESSNNQNEGGKNQYLKRERVVGTYQRALPLSGPVKESAMTTNYSNVVLTISIPKA
jgi:hypothetical protein